MRIYTRKDRASPPTTIDLAVHGIRPGDTIRLEQVGQFFGGKREATQLGGVFSSSTETLDLDTEHRIPGAIDAGLEHASSNTFYGKL